MQAYVMEHPGVPGLPETALLIDREDGSPLLEVLPTGETGQRWTLPDTAAALLTADTVRAETLEQVVQRLAEVSMSKTARASLDKALDKLQYP